MPTQSEKAAVFRALHEKARAFVIPNPWDAGSARILAGLGFAALATSSGASAGILEAAGVKRISLATSLYRAAMSGLIDAAREVKEHGTFGYLDQTLSTPDLNGFMRP